MTLKKCLEIGDACGLETVAECILNIELHAPSLFDYKKINEELLELYKGWNDFEGSTHFVLESTVANVLKWIQKNGE